MAKRKFERTCSCCQTKYSYCPNCSEFDKLPRWMDAYCSENCRELYNITAGWINDWLDKDEEIARLEKADLSRIDKFPEWMQKVISEMKNYKPQVSVDVHLNVLSENDVPENKATAEVKIDHNDPKIESKNRTTPSSIPKEFKRVDYSKKKNDYKKQ